MYQKLMKMGKVLTLKLQCSEYITYQDMLHRCLQSCVGQPLTHTFIFTYIQYSIPLCFPVMPIMLLKLTYNYVENFFSTKTKYLIFYCTEAWQKHFLEMIAAGGFLKGLRGQPIILTGLKIFAYYSSTIPYMLLNAYYFPNYASIII